MQINLRLGGVFTVIFLSGSVAGVLLNLVPVGKNGKKFPVNLIVCKPNDDYMAGYRKASGIDPRLIAYDPRGPKGGCSWWNSEGFYWDFAPQRWSPEGHSLIQITGGPDTENQPGITNQITAYKPFHYELLREKSEEEDGVFRSFFRVKRNGEYQNFDKAAGRLQEPKDELLKKGDVLEFWGTSQGKDPKNQLYVKLWTPGVEGEWSITRAPDYYDEANSPQVELRVAGGGYGQMESPQFTDYDFTDDVENINRNTRLVEDLGKVQDCGLGRICKLAATKARKAIKSLFGGSGRSASAGLVIDPIDMEDANNNPLSSQRGLKSSRENSVLMSLRDGDSRESSSNTMGENERRILESLGITEPRDFDLIDPEAEPRAMLEDNTRKSTLSNVKIDLYSIPERTEPDTEGAETPAVFRRIGATPRGSPFGSQILTPLSWNMRDPQLKSWSNVDQPGTIDMSPDFDEIPEENDEDRNGSDLSDEERKESTPKVLEPSGGALEKTLFHVPTRWRAPEKLVAPAIQLGEMPVDMYKQNLAFRRFNQYLECIRKLAHREGDYGMESGIPPDAQLLWMIDNGYGMYSLQDFETAIAEQRAPPQCPKSREEMIDLSEQLGQEKYSPPANNDNPQDGVE